MKYQVSVEKNIDNLRLEWEDLYGRSSGAYPYLSYSWTAPFINHKKFHGKLFILCVWHEQKLFAILPLAVRRVLGVRISQPIGYYGYLGLLVDPNHPDVMEMFLEKIQEYVDVYYSNNISSIDQSTQQFLGILTKRYHWVSYSSQRNLCRIIDLPKDFETYYTQHKSSKTRSTIRRKERLLHESHRVNIEFYDKQIPTNVFTRIADIQQDSWMKRRGAAVLHQAFYQDLMMRLSQTGSCWIWIMTIDGEDAAFIFALIGHKKLCYQWTAFRLRYQNFPSIGQILTKSSIEKACEMGIESYDFGHGDADYKQFWATSQHTVNRVVVGHGIRGGIVGRLIYAFWILRRTQILRDVGRKLKLSARRLLGGR